MMTRIAILSAEQERRSLAWDFIALAIVYFIPAISHAISFPLYYFEPMRIMVILAIAHTTKKNAYLLAITLPLFSLLTSGHPVLYKSVLMSVELSLNVFLFYLISRRLENHFVSMLLSILLSKAVYYLVKFILINISLVHLELVSTPLLIQVFVSLAISAYLFLIFYRKQFDGSLVDPTKDESLY